MLSLDELSNERDVLVKEAQSVINARLALNEPLSNEERDKLKSANARLAEIDSEYNRISEDSVIIDAFSSRKSGYSADTANSGRVSGLKMVDSSYGKSVGQIAIDRLGPDLKARRESGEGGRYQLETGDISVKAIDFQASAPFSSGDGQPYVTDYDWSVQRQKRDRLVIADLMGAGQVSGNTIEYLVESPLVEGDFSTVAEGERLPQVQFGNPESVIETIKTIGAYTKHTNNAMEDLPFLISEIDVRLSYKLRVKEEQQLLNGDGSDQNILGLLKRPGIQKLVSPTAEADVDTIFKAKTRIGLYTDYSADALVINPLDYEQFRLARDGNGQYFGGGFFQGQYGVGGVAVDPPLWGLRTLTTNAVEPGKAIVGAFSIASTVYRKGGVRIDISNSDGDDFIRLKNTVRISERIGLAVRQPLAFVEVTFASPAASQTPPKKG